MGFFRRQIELHLKVGALHIGKELFEMGLMTKGEFYDYLVENEIVGQKLKIKGSSEYNDASLGGESASSGASAFGQPQDITIKTGVTEGEG